MGQHAFTKELQAKSTPKVQTRIGGTQYINVMNHIQGSLWHHFDCIHSAHKLYNLHHSFVPSLSWSITLANEYYSVFREENEQLNLLWPNVAASAISFVNVWDLLLGFWLVQASWLGEQNIANKDWKREHLPTRTVTCLHLPNRDQHCQGTVFGWDTGYIRIHHVIIEIAWNWCTFQLSCIDQANSTENVQQMFGISSPRPTTKEVPLTWYGNKT